MGAQERGEAVVRPTNVKKCVKLHGNFQRGGLYFLELYHVKAEHSGLIYILQCVGTGKTFLQTCIPQASFKAVS